MKEAHCPFLETTTVTFCKAFPMGKMIPVDRNSPHECACTSAAFRSCGIYSDRDHSPRQEKGESCRGFLQRPDYYLHPRHAWLALPEDGRSRARVGIDDLAQKLLGRVDRISVPANGTVVRENAICTILHSGPRSLRMVAPVDGVILGANPEVLADPSCVNRSPFEDGWILSLSPTGDGCKRLLHGAPARSWFEWEVEKLQRCLSPAVGATAADGGESVPDIGGTIDESRWAGIAAVFFG
jgi:glycine cleavage system H protein